MNNVECFICHNFGHVVARYRSRMVQANNHHTERPLASRYFKGYGFLAICLVTKALISIEGI